MKTIMMGIFFISLSVNVYFFSKENKSVEQITDEVSLTESAIAKTSLKEAKVKKLEMNSAKLVNRTEHRNVMKSTPCADIGQNNLKKEELIDEKEESIPDDYSYDEMKKAWERKVSSYFEEDLGLEESKVDQYFKIKAEYSKAMDEYFSSLDDKIPEGETVFIDADQQIASAKIKIEFLDKLKAKIGQDSYQKYIKFRHKYNNGLLNDSNNEGHIIVDF